MLRPLRSVVLTLVLMAAGAPVKAKDPAPRFPEMQVVGIEGWTVHVERSLLDGEHKDLGMRSIGMLQNHLQRIAICVAEPQLAKMRKLEIWLEHHHELAGMQYHPDLDWLKEKGYDPRLVKKVHLPRAEELLSRKHMLKHPAVILHELAHAYHDQVLGFGHEDILSAYDQAMKEKLYDQALLYTGETVRHYGATDHKEYFAESTESYFYHNDFYPFVRAELKRHDPRAYAVMEKVWGKIEH